MILCLFLAMLPAMELRGQQLVTFPTADGGVVEGDLYGTGSHGVVLVHGGRFRKESWQDQARVLAAAGMRVLSIHLRGYGASRGPGMEDLFTAPLEQDVLAAVRYLRKAGGTRISVMGGSMGGAAAAAAVAIAKPGEIERLVLLGATPDVAAEKLTVRKLYLMAKDDASGDGPRLPGLRAHFEKAPEPKRLVVLEGSAHAQFLFESDQAVRVMQEIVRFLTE